MFTGIVEEVGMIKSVIQSGSTYQITLVSKKLLSDVKLGDSIAVNGVCLTVTHFLNQHFTVDVMPETLKATNLASLKPNMLINLERALRADSRLGGHFVSGHVDCVGKITRIKPSKNAIYITLSITADYLRFLVNKGSVALDGTSLTVFEVDDQSTTFTVSLIPHTAQQTILGQKQLGDWVNIECDMLAKYLQRLTQFPTDTVYQGANEFSVKPSTGVTNELLHRAGFI